MKTEYSIVEISATLIRKDAVCNFAGDLYFFDVDLEKITKTVAVSSDNDFSDTKGIALQFMQDSVGFLFHIVHEGYRNNNGIGWDIEAIGYEDVFKEFSDELTTEARLLFNNIPEKEFIDGIAHVNFLGLFSMDCWQDGYGEYDSRNELVGFFESKQILSLIERKK